VKKPDVIQKNELYFCNQGSNVIQNQLSKSKHRLKSFVLQACVMALIDETDRTPSIINLHPSSKETSRLKPKTSNFFSLVHGITMV
jgi:hypothetical protein